MSLWTSGYCIYQVLELSVSVLALGRVGRYTRQIGDGRAETMARRIIEKTRMHITVRGEPIPDGRACVVMSNHQSMMDIPVMWHVMRGHTLRFVAKAELFKVPVWGRALEFSECVKIDRNDIASAIESIARAGELVDSGVNVWIAPEGTRSVDGRLSPLKKGGFHLAKNTGARILPVAVNGTINVLPPHTVLSRKDIPVDVYVGKPIESADRNIEDLMADVQEFLDAHVDQDVYARG